MGPPPWIMIAGPFSWARLIALPGLMSKDNSNQMRHEIFWLSAQAHEHGRSEEDVKKGMIKLKYKTLSRV